jgi:hypothetical protein
MPHPRTDEINEEFPDADAHEGTHVKVFRSLDELEQIRNNWNSWNQHPNADFDFFSRIVRSRSEILRPHVIVLYRSGSPEAILVGRIDVTYLDIRVGYKSLYRAPVRQLTLIHGGALGNLSAENCEVLTLEVMNSFQREEAHIAFFNRIRTDFPLYLAAKRTPRFFGRDHFQTPILHWSMKLPASVEELNHKIPGDTRREVRRRTKSLNADYAGNVRIECFSQQSDLDCVFRDVEEVAKKTYQRGLGVGFSNDPERRQQFDLEARKGWLRTYILYVGDKPCAFWIGTLYAGVLHSGDVGYDPAFKKYAPGTLLLMRILEDLCGKGVKEMDFGLGDADWKQRFGNRTWHEASVYLFAPNLKVVGLYLLWESATLINEIARRGLVKTRLVPRIKAIWRDHLRRQSS